MGLAVFVQKIALYGFMIISTFAVNDSCIITLRLHRVFGPLDSLSEVTPFTSKV